MKTNERDRPKEARSPNDLGAAVLNLTPELAQRLGIDAATGVVVSGVIPGTVAARVGLQLGDVITAVGDKEVHSVDEFHRRWRVRT